MAEGIYIAVPKIVASEKGISEQYLVLDRIEGFLFFFFSPLLFFFSFFLLVPEISRQDSAGRGNNWHDGDAKMQPALEIQFSVEPVYPRAICVDWLCEVLVEVLNKSITLHALVCRAPGKKGARKDHKRGRSRAERKPTR